MVILNDIYAENFTQFHSSRVPWIGGSHLNLI